MAKEIDVKHHFRTQMSHCLFEQCLWRPPQLCCLLNDASGITQNAAASRNDASVAPITLPPLQTMPLPPPKTPPLLRTIPMGAP